MEMPLLQRKLTLLPSSGGTLVADNEIVCSRRGAIQGAVMIEVQEKRLEQYEASAVECERLALLTADRSRQAVYEHLAEHYRYLATSFREALVMHEAALAKLVN